MTATRHTLRAKLTVSRRPYGAPGTATIAVEVAYSYQPRRLSEAPQVTVIAATLLDDGGIAPTPRDVCRLAQDFLDGDGYLAACQRAEAQAA